MAIEGANLELAIRRYWTERFDLKLRAWEMPGSKVMRDEIFDDSDEIYLYRLGKYRLLRMDPAKVNWIQWPDDLKTRSVEAADLLSWVKNGTEIRLGEKHLTQYLEPSRFLPAAPVDGLETRRVDPVADDHLLRELLSQCSEEDIDNAEIYLDKPDPVIFAGFDQGRMVSYASHRYWGENIADIGVLTHPKYRHRSLGKAIVSTLCAWCLENEVIPMYRVESEHFRSRKIAEALGFDLRVEIEVLEFISPEPE
jgi:RimJ/RimL family protein N-acetyltransferase